MKNTIFILRDKTLASNEIIDILKSNGYELNKNYFITSQHNITWQNLEPEIKNAIGITCDNDNITFSHKNPIILINDAINSFHCENISEFKNKNITLSVEQLQNIFDKKIHPLEKIARIFNQPMSVYQDLVVKSESFNAKHLYDYAKCIVPNEEALYLVKYIKENERELYAKEVGLTDEEENRINNAIKNAVQLENGTFYVYVPGKLPRCLVEGKLVEKICQGKFMISSGGPVNLSYTGSKDECELLKKNFGGSVENGTWWTLEHVPVEQVLFVLGGSKEEIEAGLKRPITLPDNKKFYLPKTDKNESVLSSFIKKILNKNQRDVDEKSNTRNNQENDIEL